MAKRINRKSVPKTKLQFSKLVEGLSMLKLADEMGVTYTQLYRYKKEGANPTLLVLEQLAEGLSKLTNENVTVIDLIRAPSKKKTKSSATPQTPKERG